ncbi:uncharacterized protein LOC141856706 [Brevipalpus obovatus]|uniref:uncharacterized protein LOC141856706 n=1 Tax=Brevipalpus obovatus TaxID=246614 RepID=UPI003D9E49C6
MLGQNSSELVSDDEMEDTTTGSPASRRRAARRNMSRPRKMFRISQKEPIKFPSLGPPSFTEIFHELGKIFREGDEALIQEDLTFLLKWGLKYGSKLSSYKASQAESSLINLLIEPYELLESSIDLNYLTIPKLMISFPSNTMKLAKEMPDTVSGVGEDKRLECPAYARVVAMMRLDDPDLAKLHEEAHLYARYMFSEAVNRRNQSWISKSISLKIEEVEHFYQVVEKGWPAFVQKQLLAPSTGGENMIPPRIIDEAAAKWRELLIEAKAK